PPTIRSPTQVQEQELKEVECGLHGAESRYAALLADLQAVQSSWENSFHSSQPIQWFSSDHLIAHFSLDGEADSLEGPCGRAARLDGRRFIQAENAGELGFYDKFTLSAWILAEGTQGGTILSRMEDVDEGKGYSFGLKDGKLQLNLVVRWLDDA